MLSVEKRNGLTRGLQISVDVEVGPAHGDVPLVVEAVLKGGAGVVPAQEEEEAAVAADGAEEVGAVLAPADLQVELPVLAALVVARDLKGADG